MRELSSLDIGILVNELQFLVGGKIQKIYHEDEEVHINIYVKNKGTSTLVLGNWQFFATSYSLKHASSPTSFCMFLRRRLQNQIIEKIEQLNFERVVSIETSANKLIVELFSTGNVILTDKENKIISAMKLQKWKDRNLIKDAIYTLPPSCINPKRLSEEKAEEIFKNADKSVVAFLARELSFGGLYAEEILENAKISKDKNCSKLSKNEIKRLVEEIKKIMQCKKSPAIIMEKEKMVDFIPFEIKKYAKSDKKKFLTYNEAVDEFFVLSKKTAIEKEVEQQKTKKESLLVRRYTEQKEAFASLEKKIVDFKEMADLIYMHLNEIEKIIRAIEEEGKSIGWEALKERIEQKKMADVKAIDTKEKWITIEFEKPIKINYEFSVPKNASYYYDKSKKMKEKIEGLKKAIYITEQKMKALGEQEDKKVGIEKKGLKEKEWFDAFRHFITTNNFLCVAGKDATTNEILIRKHLDKDDIVLHTDMGGSPFLIIKSSGKFVSLEDVKEAAQFVAVYSKAWGMNVGSLEVFYVNSEQVSKAAPAGEYITKGSFMIYGKKNWLKAELKLAIAFYNNEIIAGPVNAIKSKTSKFIVIQPGRTKSKELAKKIKTALFEKCNDSERAILRKLNIEEIQKFIPAGTGELSK